MNSNRFLQLTALDPEEWSPRDISEVISWQGHIPFAFALIRAFQPRCFVELGTHKGDSYLAFCEAVVRSSSATRCYAVDTWAGDKHAGHYGDDVLAGLRVKHDEAYGKFSTLTQSTFDDALSRFEDGTVDLLHIDGLHTYEAVRHDFESWKGKLSDRAIVLFHDTTVRRDDFGVWRYWRELCSQYPSFEFPHSNGLGVLAVGKDAPESLPDLFGISDDTKEQIRNLYRVLGDSITFEGLFKLLLQERAASGSHIAHLDNTVNALNTRLAEHDADLRRRDEQIADLNRKLSVVVDTRLWKYASLINRVSRAARFAGEHPREAMLALMRKTYHRLPVSTVQRNQVKGWFYRRFPSVFPTRYRIACGRRR